MFGGMVVRETAEILTADSRPARQREHHPAVEHYRHSHTDLLPQPDDLRVVVDGRNDVVAQRQCCVFA